LQRMEQRAGLTPHAVVQVSLQLVALTYLSQP
jgi:hypothetical protein